MSISNLVDGDSTNNYKLNLSQALMTAAFPSTQTTTNNAVHPVNFTGINQEGDCFEFDLASPTKIKVSVPGVYILNATVTFSTSGIGERDMWFTAPHNIGHITILPVSSAGTRVNISAIEYMDGTEEIGLNILQNSGGNLTVQPVNGLCRFIMKRLN